ncbi:hypothetical protein DAEQUDRAFT_731692 [Daedalea quercina L-15889]|uniref:Uncharacterized protein n=1 Tax=Daedalea quercina L-15889 TaxID=1314783 RepID=A0A165M3C6_9APHY|nr:hypothetical protein DAEQUDRAFT_731692 [Daedalea quercina L-15889]
MAPSAVRAALLGITPITNRTLHRAPPSARFRTLPHPRSLLLYTLALVSCSSHPHDRGGSLMLLHIVQGVQFSTRSRPRCRAVRHAWDAG